MNLSAIGLAVAKNLPMINSVMGEQARIDNVLPLALKHKTSLILMALDDNGIQGSGRPDGNRAQYFVIIIFYMHPKNSA
jgi:cobalamin-dependent methionine synthase I